MPVPLLLYGSWAQIFLDWTAQMLYIVAFHFLLILWSSLLNSILPFNSPLARESAIKSIQGVIYTGVGWLILKYSLVVLRWAGVRPREPLVVTKVSRYLDALHFTVVGSIFLLYCVVLRRTMSSASQTKRVRKSLTTLLTMSGIGTASFIILGLRELVYYQPVVVDHADVLVGLHGLRVIVFTVRAIGLLIILGVKLPKHSASHRMDIEGKGKFVSPDKSLTTTFADGKKIGQDSAWILSRSINTAAAPSEIDSKFMHHNLGWTGANSAAPCDSDDDTVAPSSSGKV